jgi:hypothetical protein
MQVRREVRPQGNTESLLDDSAIPDRVEVGRFAEIGEVDVVATLVVMVLRVKWLVDVPHEVNDEFKRHQSISRGGILITEDAGEVLNLGDDAIVSRAVPVGIVGGNPQGYIHEMPTRRL